MNSSTAWLALKSLEGGIQLTTTHAAEADRLSSELTSLLNEWGLASAVQALTLPLHGRQVALICTLRPDFRAQCMPGHDTLALHEKLGRPTQTDEAWALEREIWVALLGSPHRFQFASLDSLTSHIRVRRNMALDARKTALAFKTDAAERPQTYWRDGELQSENPELLAQLQSLNEIHAVRSGQFHEVYLVEYGSIEAPLPGRFYVPGDRLWFRNPDERSSDVTGYEGSWVIYMGGGLFSNFWKRDTPYTLESKAIEIFHWKDGAYTDAQGALQMDETVVEALVAQTEANPSARAQVLERMLRMRDPQGVYAEA
eukprot:gene3920-3834_t